jgi:hypothetical protein
MCNFIYGVVFTLCCGILTEVFRQGFVSLLVLVLIVAATVVSTAALQALKRSN